MITPPPFVGFSISLEANDGALTQKQSTPKAANDYLIFKFFPLE
jgi:hypothetical protein